MSESPTEPSATPEKSGLDSVVAPFFDLLKQGLSIEIGTPYGRLNALTTVLLVAMAFASTVSGAVDKGAATFMDFMPWIFGTFVVCSGTMLALDRGRDNDRRVIEGNTDVSKAVEPKRKRRATQKRSLPPGE